MMIVLEHWWVWLLFPLPWIMRAILPKTDQGQSAQLRVPFYSDVSELAGKKHSTIIKRSFRWRLLLFLLWFCLILAGTNPQFIGEPVSIHSEARDLMLAVDISASMDEFHDMRVKGEQTDRLTAVKSVLEEFIDRRATDRLGLILFGSQAYLQTPLTFDHVTLHQLLKEAQIGIAGPRTAIGDAIGLAIKRLKDRPAESKVLILLTDGANTAGEISPLQAAELAAQKELKIYTVGVGADEVVLPGIFGSRFGQRKINPSADLDEGTLEKIAELTGGQYFRAKNTDELRRIYEMLDDLEPAEADPEVFRPIRSLFYWPLGLVLLLSGLIALRAIISDWSARIKARNHQKSFNTQNPNSTT
ncbi:MAG: VWA domain-containing protein [Pseudomonadales bacterium]|nr:VWA domain-containing protein [Pseudomonadales bacterium]